MQNNNTNSGIIELTSAQRIRRACSVIIPLCFLSVLISAATISAANDIYAFVKPNNTVTLSFDESSSVYSVACTLEEKGVINNPALFSLYVKSKHREEKIEKFRGDITLRTNISYREILSAFS